MGNEPERGVLTLIGHKACGQDCGRASGGICYSIISSRDKSDVWPQIQMWPGWGRMGGLTAAFPLGLSALVPCARATRSVRRSRSPRGDYWMRLSPVESLHYSIRYPLLLDQNS